MSEFSKEALQEALTDAIMASGLLTTLEKVSKLENALVGTSGVPGLLTQMALVDERIAQIRDQGDRVEAFMVRNDSDRVKIMQTLKEMEISQFESSANLRSETESLDASVTEINKKLDPLVQWKENIVGWVVKGGAIVAGVSFISGVASYAVLNYFGFITAVFQVMRGTPHG